MVSKILPIGLLYLKLGPYNIAKTCKCKSQFIAKYNYKDFVLLSPQRVAINGAIICRGFEPGFSRSRVRHSTAEPQRLHMSLDADNFSTIVICYCPDSVNFTVIITFNLKKGQFKLAELHKRPNMQL